MVYRMDDIVALAKSAPTMPTGMGNVKLAKNPESWAPYLRFLGAVMQTYKPRVALELGVYMATATRHMAVGAPESKVIGVDIEFHPDAFNNVQDHPNIELIQGDSVAAKTVYKNHQDLKARRYMVKENNIEFIREIYRLLNLKVGLVI